MKTMYDELIKRLRASCESCKLWDGYKCCLKGECSAQKSLQAADAIEELQKQLREEKVDNVNLTGWLAEEHAKAEDFENRLNLWRQGKIRRWIPVTERFPKIDEQVLCWLFGECYIGSLGYCVDRENGQYKFINRVEWNFDEFSIGGEDFSNVTHWMPLPEPPKDVET